MTPDEPFLTDVLAFNLPSPRQTLLLRATLWPDERAAPALKAWSETSDAPTDELADEFRGGRLLAPLLCRLTGGGQSVDAGLTTYLRIARVREELRLSAYRRIARQVVAALGNLDERPLLIRGAALAETVWPGPLLRHSGTIDLLATEHAAAETVAALEAAGFVSLGERATPACENMTRVLRHPSGLPVLVHVHPCGRRARHPGTTADEVFARATELRYLDTHARVPSAADQLVHVIGAAASGWERSNLLWVCDAWLLAERLGPGDWEIVADAVESCGLALPAHTVLRYLARELEVEVPGPVRDRLADRAAQADRVERETALADAWVGPGLKLGRALRAARSWRARGFVLRWRVAPSIGTLLAEGQIERPSEAVLHYAWRPLRFIGRALFSERAR